MSWDVDTALVDDWLDSLNDEAYDHVVAALEFLADHGPTTGRPFVDTVEGSVHANMKELRPPRTSAGEYIRILFAFDVESRAIVLVGGDKAGNWKKWYAKNIPVADALFSEHQERARARRAKAQTTGKSRKGRKKR